MDDSDAGDDRSSVPTQIFSQWDLKIQASMNSMKDIKSEKSFDEI